MTKRAWIDRLNQVINGPRGVFARKMWAEALILNGRVLYRDRAKGYPRKISLAELLRLFHGEDIRELKAAQ